MIAFSAVTLQDSAPSSQSSASEPARSRQRLRLPGRGMARLGRTYVLARKVVDTAGDHDVDIVAAGLAFYGLLGLFPTLLATVSLYGLIADPADVQRVLTPLIVNLPEQARTVVGAGLSEFVTRSSGRLSLSLVLSLLTLLFSASTAMSALVRAINVAYAIPERRSFFKRRRVAIVATAAAIAGFAIIVPIIAALPRLLEFLQLRSVGLSSVVLIALAFLALLVLYRYAPDRETPPTVRGTLPGAVAASLLWLAFGALYSLYVKYLANFGSTYGALEGVIVLQFWLFISALVLLYGAELNAELERAG
jgi:membrane protein